ncbi:hypothetical protein ONZ51_g3976 [Trametes cubensis]|uniref:Poly(A) RNA polymerase mitochondrial-like central palm domain-containing protein n=1 Tax=Trametes cubensis TaxID=1111947 RepID=A0AAD7XD01_9APHY|nr:hypothetical protein ONZ51_g3976 [Trametes cubensis]
MRQQGPMASSPLRLKREHAIGKLSAFIRKQYGEQYQVRVFGSTCYGASSRDSSDLDLTIFDSERPYGIEPWDERQLPAIYSVNDLAKKLKHRGYLNVSAVAKATVPIGGSSNDDVPMQPQCINANCPHRACLPAAVKCTDPKTGVTFDVNINNRLGVYNTALLRQYCLLDPSLPYFLKVVKLWMYSRGLNSASGRHGPPSFSSYAITIMTIALYQHFELLPNLQADKQAILQTHFWEKRGGVQRKIDVRFGACKDWRPPQTARPLILRDWFDIRDGGFVDRPSEIPSIWGPPFPGTGNVVVLDPLTFKNCTHMISSETLAKFRRECMDMLNRMKRNKAWSTQLQDYVSLVADPEYSDYALTALRRTYFPR